MKSITECLNFIDNMILLGREKHIGIGNLEDIHDYIMGMNDYEDIEDKIAMSKVLSQINLIIENFI